MKKPHKARKRFGQNFLVAPRIIDSIIAAIAPTPDDIIIEIGPGLGAITEFLVQSGAKVYAIELDRDLIPRLEDKFADDLKKNFWLYQQDVLTFDFAKWYAEHCSPGQKIKIVGNLPYNISTPLLFKVFNHADIIASMHFMLQKEVAVRLTANVGNKQYGKLTVMADYYCKMQKVIEVPEDSFDPPPKVKSAVVRFMPHQQPIVSVTDPNLLAEVCQAGFNQRRKTIANSLQDFISAAGLQHLGIDPGLRAENLSIHEFAAIANYVTANS